jgi:hypothetical protein
VRAAKQEIEELEALMRRAEIEAEAVEGMVEGEGDLLDDFVLTATAAVSLRSCIFEGWGWGGTRRWRGGKASTRCVVILSLSGEGMGPAHTSREGMELMPSSTTHFPHGICTLAAERG